MSDDKLWDNAFSHAEAVIGLSRSDNVGGLVELLPLPLPYDEPRVGYSAREMQSYAAACVEAALSAHSQPVVDEAMAQKFWDGYEQYFVDLSADELFDGKDRKIEAAMSALTAALTDQGRTNES